MTVSPFDQAAFEEFMRQSAPAPTNGSKPAIVDENDPATTAMPLEQAPSALRAGPRPLVPPEQPTEISGDNRSQYRILQPIGRKGMSTVYLAYQPTMKRNVAIKVLPPRLTNEPQFAARFRNEAEIAARLEHQNILPVYDYGEAAGFIYIVMRYIPTGSLRQRLDTGSMTPIIAYKIIVQVARALDYAHRHNVIHCDVKPSNVLIDMDDQAYLTDFGISRIIYAGTRGTQSNAIIGTRGYMAPEQWRGDTLDRRADIYSLGVLVLEMLTVQAIPDVNGAPERRAQNADLPEPILKVIRKAMANKPQDRFQTVGEFTVALGEAIQAAPKSWLETGLKAQSSPAMMTPDEQLSVNATEILLADRTSAISKPPEISNGSSGEKPAKRTASLEDAWQDVAQWILKNLIRPSS